ncbi:pseudouridine synthase [Candidatus Parcubacteria bacterium]|nr:pseudouridine synthase [Candidatus Parcubacteria bacterium]
MRLNRYLALHAGLSRRAGDRAIEQGRVYVDGLPAKLGQAVLPDSEVSLDGEKISPEIKTQTIMLHKPIGYVCSKAGQGSQTIYDLLPKDLHHLNPIGRLDKDSSGLLLLTNDGLLANKLAHPRYQKTKAYEIEIDRPLSEPDFHKITRAGVDIGDSKPSSFRLEARSMSQESSSGSKKHASCFLPHTSAWQVTLAEGRNRQIRRTFAVLGYKIRLLRRVEFGPYKLDNLTSGSFQVIL